MIEANVSNLVNEIQNSFKDDNRIDNKELKQLKALLNNSDVSDDIKNKVATFLEHANDASKTFFGIFPSKISESELNSLRTELEQLKETVAPLGVENKLAKDLVEAIDKSLPTPQIHTNDNNDTNSYRSNNSNPVANFLSKLFSGFSEDAERNSVENQGDDNNRTGALLKDNATLKAAHLSQFDSGLPSEKGDCGPTSGAIILRCFGFDANVETVRNNAPGKPSRAPWALTENQISSSISKLSNGQVKQSDMKTYNPKGDPNALKEKLISDIRNDLEQGKLPMLCMGTGEWTNKHGSRHYVVVTGIDDNGNLQYLDPANPTNGSGASYMDSEKLMERILSTRNADNPSITLTSFEKVQN